MIEKGRIPALDGVRGLAILLVLFHHFTIIIPRTRVETYWKEISELGRYGVDLFFVLSGFLITGILINSRNKPDYFRNFYIRRSLRIFPLYYLLVIGSLTVLPKLLNLLPPPLSEQIASQTVAGHWLWYATYCSNFLIALQNKYSHGTLDISWSLCIEEHFYLIWPFLIYTCGNSTVKKICVWAISGALALRILLWSLGFSRLQIYVLTFTRIDAILFGALLAVLFAEPSTRAKWASLSRKKLFLGLGFVLAALALYGQFRYDSFTMNTIGYTVVAIFFLLLIDLCLPGQNGNNFERFFDHPFFKFFGKYSYALYIFHLPSTYFTKHVFFRGNDFHSLPGFAILWQFIFYVIATLVSVLLALASWNLLEKPMLSLKEKLTKMKPVNAVHPKL